MLESRDWGPGL